VDGKQIIDRVREEGRKVLTEVESKVLLSWAGIPTVDTRAAGTQREALAVSKELGFPVVLKVHSPDILHKTDVGGVRLGIANGSQVVRAYREILASAREKAPLARIEGVSVQRMAPSGVEVILGMSKDPQFGPVIMFGLGGILVELLKDVSFRVVPLTQRDAREMIREVKGYPLLEGYRGQAPADVECLVEMTVSRFAEQNPQVKALDLNPVIATKEGAIAVDARVVLEDE